MVTTVGTAYLAPVEFQERNGHRPVILEADDSLCAHDERPTSLLPMG